MKHLFTKAPAAFAGAAALLAGGLLADPASAQGETESMMTLGGYSNYTVSFTKHPGGSVLEQDGDISIYNNTEIFFNGSAETDGGLQVSARVELEGNTTSDQIDEHYITVSGGFGALEIGANDSADERTAKGILYNSTAVDYWYSNEGVVPSVAGYRGLGQNDGMGLNYTTPSLGGATFAISYKPSTEGADTHRTDGDQNLFAFGASYSGDMGGITVDASFGYNQQDVPEDVSRGGFKTHESDSSAWGIGGAVGFGDTKIYARYQKEDQEVKGSVASTETASILRADNLLGGKTSYEVDEVERKITALAVSHAIGPAKLGLAWVQSTQEGYRGDVQKLENEDTMVIGSVDYTLGQGVTLAGYVAWGDAERLYDRAPFAATPTDEEIDESGTALGVALDLAF